MITKRTEGHLERVRCALNEMESGLRGYPFTWGSSEAQSKTRILEQLGYSLVTKTKLESGGFQLKKNALPVGKRYYNAPISKYRELFVLELQCERTVKWYELHEKGKALLEAIYRYGEYSEYGSRS